MVVIDLLGSASILFGMKTLPGAQCDALGGTCSNVRRPTRHHYDLVQVQAVSGAVTRMSLAIPLFPFSEVPRDLAEQHCQIAEGLRLSLRIGQNRRDPIASCSLFEIP